MFCDCYDTETGELLDADPRQNLKRVVDEFEQELGYQFLIGIEPEMMWLKKGEEGSEPEGVTKPYCYHIHQFEELRPVLLDVVEYGQALGLDMSYGDHEDAPASSSSTSVSTGRSRPPTTPRPIARSAPRWAASTAFCRPSCRAVHGRVSANGHHHHFTLMDDEGNNVFHDQTGRRSCRTPPDFLGGMRSTSAR